MTDEQIAAARAVIAAATPGPWYPNRAPKGDFADWWVYALPANDSQTETTICELLNMQYYANKAPDYPWDRNPVEVNDANMAYIAASRDPEIGWGAVLTALEEARERLAALSAERHPDITLIEGQRLVSEIGLKHLARAEAAEAALAEARATNTRLNRRAQKAERRVARWQITPFETVRSCNRWRKAWRWAAGVATKREMEERARRKAAEAECERLRAGICKAIDQAYGCGYSGHRGTGEPKAFYETLHALVGTANELETPAA